MTQSPQETTLPRLAIGSSASVLRITPGFRGSKKFADIGLIPGATVEMESHAPFGGLLRIRVMGTSMSIHRDDAECVIISQA